MATPITLRFDPGLTYQQDAVAAAVDLFAGQAPAEATFRAALNTGARLLTEFGVGNRLDLDPAAMLDNLRAVQARHHLDQTTAQGTRDFTVEMETGTGKTYVYLRTAFALHQAYGFTKFVIVVPSVAIREGVLHSLATMREHFRALFGVPFDHATYDSRRLGVLRAFATANTLQFLVMNIQAFQRDIGEGDDAGRANVIYRENDRLSGQRPIDFLRSTRPIVIIDEPQKMTGGASTAAIERLDPLYTLRYSATPPPGSTRIYRLGPIEAFDTGLVKRIEVASVRADSNANDAHVRLLKVDAAKQTAQVQINVGTGAIVKDKAVTIRRGDDLYLKSQGGRLDAGRQEYRSGYRVEEISFRPDDAFVAFSGGRTVRLGQAIGGQTDDIMRAQVYATVKEHLDKERHLRPAGVKVLSLFFIDRVASYRTYNADGSYSLGKVGEWFEEAFAELSGEERYQGVITDPVNTIHGGYFATDRKGQFRDSTERGNKEDEGAYELIMRNKERLLSLDEPLRFIFSHSALREGWDNPNVFQICTLNETRSVTQKRQEIGRGLRLPVGADGARIHDQETNRLTVIANESYRDFAAQLQREYEADGVEFGVIRRTDFAHLVRSDSGDGQPIGEHESGRIFDALVFKRMIDADGRIQPSFDPFAKGHERLTDEAFAGLDLQVVDTMANRTIERRLGDARERRRVRVQDGVLQGANFRALWDRISRRTRYSVHFRTDDVVALAVERLRNARDRIEAPRIIVDTADINVSRKEIREGATTRTWDREVATAPPIPDILAYLQNETDLTRDTLVRILRESGRLPDLLVNSQSFLTMATREIRSAVQKLTIDSIRYEPIPDDTWELGRLRRESDAGVERYLSRLYQLRNSTKSPYESIAFDSQVERQFAEALDNDQNVECFIKLPAWYTVDTPVGTYNPDWAISIRGDERVYLVQETKGTLILDDLRQPEQQKIACATRHYDAISVEYGVATDAGTVVRDALRRRRDRVSAG